MFNEVFIFSIVNGNRMVAIKKYFLYDFRVGFCRVVSSMNLFVCPLLILKTFLETLEAYSLLSHPSVLFFMHSQSCILFIVVRFCFLWGVANASLYVIWFSVKNNAECSSHSSLPEQFVSYSIDQAIC